MTLTTIWLLVYLYTTTVAPNTSDDAVGSYRIATNSLAECKDKGSAALKKATDAGGSAHYACIVIVEKDKPVWQ
jgi:hypothetical protein